MARVKICAAEGCGHANDADGFFCKGVLRDGQVCGAPIDDLPEAETDAAADVVRGAARDKHEEAPPAPARTTREIPVRQASLDFPWGPEPINGRLAVGRDWAFSPLAGRLQTAPTVSRVHAELHFDGARLVVRHLGQANPTYVQGRPLATGESLELVHGDEVSFSQDLRVRVRIE